LLHKTGCCEAAVFLTPPHFSELFSIGILPNNLCGGSEDVGLPPRLKSEIAIRQKTSPEKK
jgi:hypothetical protein